MANQVLLNKTYKIPSNVLKYIQTTLISNPNSEGIKRAKFIIKNGILTYQALKRLKNFFDTFNPSTDDNIQYALAGGNLMKSFIDVTLNQDRAGVRRSKETKRDMSVDVNLGTKAYNGAPNLNEVEKKELEKNAVAVIVNNDNKILLLKRADNKKMWQPNKWSLVGGSIERGESPEEAVKREIKEEINLDIKKFISSFTIKRNGDSIEHVFACRFEGEPTEIAVDQKENSQYGWFDISEMEFLDTVPHLIEYITLVFKSYEK